MSVCITGARLLQCLLEADAARPSQGVIGREMLSDWAEELSDSELRALRDPRNWVRPVVAVSAGGIATGALVLLELRRRGKQQSESGLRSLTGGLRSRALGGLGGAGGPRPTLRSPGGGRETEQADQQVQGGVAAAGRQQAEDRVVGADRERPDRQRRVEEADARARSGARRQPAASRPSAPVAT